MGLTHTTQSTRVAISADTLSGHGAVAPHRGCRERGREREGREGERERGRERETHLHVVRAV